MNNNSNDIELRVIKTARNLESINEAVALGFKPFIKKLVYPPVYRTDNYIFE